MEKPGHEQTSGRRSRPLTEEQSSRALPVFSAAADAPIGVHGPEPPHQIVAAGSIVAEAQIVRNMASSVILASEMRGLRASLTKGAAGKAPGVEVATGAGKAVAKDKGKEAEKARTIAARKEHTLPQDVLLANLETRYLANGKIQGLSAAAYEQRVRQFGPNKLTPPPSTPEIVKFLKQISSFFALLLWAGGILCFLYLGIVLCAVVLISGAFGYFQERKSSQLMESFKEMLPSRCKVYRNGEPSDVTAESLVPGDILELTAGNKIPADLVLLSCSDDMQVDNSSLTGESEPCKRSTKCTSDNTLESQNSAFFGTSIPKGNCVGVVVYTGDNTFMGQIANLAVTTDQQDTPIAKELHRFIMIISTVAIVLGVLFLIIGFAKGTDIVTNLVFVIGIIVANVPEGLLVTVTVCLTLTSNKMFLKSVLVKNLEGVETLGSTSCICSDKTGTLTQNMMTVANVVYDNRIHHCACSMYSKSNVDFEKPSMEKLLQCAVLCNNAVYDENSKYRQNKDGKPDKTQPIPYEETFELGDRTKAKRFAWKPLGDASESALIKFATSNQVDIEKVRASYPKVKEIPFNSTNKFQCSLHEVREEGVFKEYLMVMKGAPERIIDRCKWAMHNGVTEVIDEAELKYIQRIQYTMSKNGLRVLGFAQLHLDPARYPEGYTFNSDTPNFPLGEKWQTPELIPSLPQYKFKDDISQPLVFLGFMAMIDPPRPQVPGAVEVCKTAGIRVVMVTGDHPVTAKAIAQKIGIVWSRTREDIIESNHLRHASMGEPGWEDPDYARAIVVPGWDFNENTPDEVWDDILAHNEIVFARTSPDQKLLIVKNFQKRGDIVAVTGDGVNDAPALRRADIGIAMGIMGSAVSKEAADMILLDDNFASIVHGVEQGRLIFDNLKKSIAYTLSSNIPEIGPFLSFIIVNIPLPLDTVLILCIDLGTDMVPAISMAWEEAESDIMKRPPRDSRQDKLVTGKLVTFAYLQIGVVQWMAAFMTWFIVLNDYGYPYWTLMGLSSYDNYGKQTLYCRYTGGTYVNIEGAGLDVEIPWAQRNKEMVDKIHFDFFQKDYWFWKGNTNDIETCLYAAKNFRGTAKNTGADGTPFSSLEADPNYTAGLNVVTEQSIDALYRAGFVEHIPFASANSVFWNSAWLRADPKGSYPGLGTGSAPIIGFSYQPPVPFFGQDLSTTSKVSQGMPMALDLLEEKYMYTKASRPSFIRQGEYHFPSLMFKESDTSYRLNIASRMCQKEALHHAQSSYFVAIVIVQWADLVICKTRMCSLFEQGMRNPAMTFGLVFETILASFLCYTPNLGTALGTRPIRFTHWFPSIPFAILIVLYDEIRKLIMRRTTKVTMDPITKQIYRNPGWMERNTYY